MDDASLAALRTAASALADIGFAGVVGALVTGWILAVPHRGLEVRAKPARWAWTRARAARRAMGLAGGVALGASLAWMWIVAMALTDRGPVDALGEWRGVVGTHAGAAWTLQVGALLACIAAAAPLLARQWWPRAAALLATFGALAFALARASAGHAGASGFDAQTLVMAIHLGATATWAGGVLSGAAVVLRGDGLRIGDSLAARAVDQADIARYLARLSHLATAALALVVATGAASAWHAVGGRAGLLVPTRDTPTWAAVLDAKIALVAVGIALGAFNRFVTLASLRSALASPQADAMPALRRFARVLRVEAVVMVAVLVAAAVLANGAPPSP